MHVVGFANFLLDRLMSENTFSGSPKRTSMPARCYGVEACHISSTTRW